MFILLLAVAVLAVLNIRLGMELRLQKEASRATCEYCEMSEKLRELIISQAPGNEWKKWLPRFKEANDFFLKTHPYLSRFDGLPVNLP